MDLSLAISKRAADAVNNLLDDAAVKSERRIIALAVSRGIGVGSVVFYDDENRPVRRSVIDEASVEGEILKFDTAIAVCTKELNNLVTADEATPQDSLRGILTVQLLILEQSSFVENVKSLIHTERVTAEWAVRTVTDDSVRKQSSVGDPHLREKRLDIEDACTRVLKALGITEAARDAYAGAIVVARELRPSSMIELVKGRPAAVITERGGWTSHTSILAREFMIPMVSGVRNLKGVISERELVVVDGESGIVIVNPNADTAKHYERSTVDVASESLEIGFESRSQTVDGVQITIRANVDIPEAYHLARHFGAEGIGLFRSEALISAPGAIPTEEEQFEAYKRIAEVAGGSGVRVRTFDVGIDRLRGDGTSSEVNPALGLRSIRLSLHEQDFFRSQIRAILRAAAGTCIDILLPMISGVTEVVRAREIIDEEKRLLTQHGISIGTPLVGAMIEVPSGVFVSREIARKVDFMALGTNDLVQYLLAVDRDNDAVSEWYETLHPAVIRSIRQVISAAAEANIPILVCGEMAGSAFYVPLLIGLGARELSMNVNSISHIRRLISGITSDKAQELVKSIEDCETSHEIESKLRAYYSVYWPELFPPALLDAKHR